MRRLMAMAAALALVGAAPGLPSEGVGIGDLAWLTGSWESLSGDDWIEEIWSRPRGETMVGMSRTGTGPELVEFEFLRIEEDDDGRLILLASPGGRPPVRFKLVEFHGSSATFENLQHDYPQRIRYEREDEVLRATISKADGSHASSWPFRQLPSVD